MDTAKNKSHFLRALLSMEKTYTNVWDSTQSLFGIVEKQFCIEKKWATKFLEKIQNRYNILQIWDATTFSYSDIYMDWLTHQLFKQNQDYEKEHFSVRMRKNHTREIHTFQIIHTNRQRKSAYHYRPWWVNTPALSNENIMFWNWMYESITWKKVPFLPIPTVEVCFQRVILYSKRRSERLNLDYNFVIHDHKSSKKMPLFLKNLIIIESKSMDWPSKRLIKEIHKYWWKDISHMSKFLLAEQTMHQKKLTKKMKKIIKKNKKLFEISMN